MQSIILTVHNKDWLIAKVIRAIRKLTIGPYELIVVLDGCTDQSEKIVKKSLKKRMKYKILHTPDLFETKANNVGMRVAEGEHLIIVQDDMIVNEKGWNLRLAKPVQQFSDVFAVTARCAHNWVPNPDSQHLHLEEPLDNCWCDILQHTDHADRHNTPRDVFAIRDSVNRGPLLLCHESVKQLDYLDEDYAPLDMDDHDLCYRAYKQLGKIAGCYWIDYISDLSWGSTRPDGQNPASWFLRAQHKNAKLLYARHRDQIAGKKHNEERVLK